MQRFQLIQTALDALQVRLDVVVGADRSRVGEVVVQRLRAYLAAQGLPEVRVVPMAEPPTHDAITGKYRTVWAAPTARAHHMEKP